MNGNHLFVLAGDNLGGRIAPGVGGRQAPFRVLVRPGSPAAKRASLEAVADLAPNLVAAGLRQAGAAWSVVTCSVGRRATIRLVGKIAAN